LYYYTLKITCNKKQGIDVLYHQGSGTASQATPYLVKHPDLVKSMVEKAKVPEHKIKASILEYDEVKNCKDEHDNYQPIYLSVIIEDIKTNIRIFCNSV
jgi:hypothetical protein